MDICIDFDGTCVTREYPKVGKDIGAQAVLKELVKNGHKLILFTMRCDSNAGKYLTDAVDWFKNNSIELYGIQKHPTQHTWTTSPKASADLYIDDLGLGMPLKETDGKSHVDWEALRSLLTDKGLLKEQDDEEALAMLVESFESTKLARRLGYWS